MRWTVLWKPSAENALMDAWRTATDRQAVTDATERIDQFLRTMKADRTGLRGDEEDKTPPTHLLLARPLVVIYEASEQDRIVWVMALKEVPPHREGA